ncbi:hypothetical protein HNQ80_005085 [Anaerosolibacter carboniphilus]|uniref:Uncharacterized protein n=1 Tax=Anaerosolibacter carboniphilus TaxID=1417629 RepID=A0A841L2P9_9FIRM|nr:hypothetical protein [Anaerosolibacter carboniphilus]MBB6218908.1 hypothetical protein [Anaerosolibacter carboniphilus]
MEKKCLKSKTLPAVSPIKKPMDRVPVFYPEPPHYRPAGNEYDYVPRKYSVGQHMKAPTMKADKHDCGCMHPKKR